MRRTSAPSASASRRSACGEARASRSSAATGRRGSTRSWAPRRSARSRSEATSPDDVALLAYTSGTTAAPKAAMICHRNLVAMAAGVTQVDRVLDTDDIVSFLPYSWVGEQLLSVAIALHAGATVNFPEEPATVREDMREIGPHVMIGPPRFWETMCSEYQVKIADAGRLKGAAARVASDIRM